MGTPDFAMESLRALYEAGHEIIGVVTNPDRPKGRGMKMIASPVKEYALEKKIECQLSLEERMACGIGACLACVCQTKNVDGHSNVHNARVCKDGPVFKAEEVEL